ncbi:hypothetical protein FRC06_002608, partial [Ceratobasidium sp. 370]
MTPHPKKRNPRNTNPFTPLSLRRSLHPSQNTLPKPPPSLLAPRTAHQPATSNADYFHLINIQRAITKSFATKMLQNYSSAIHAFLAWCDTHNIHEDLRFPASEYVLCAYIASLSGSRSKSSINGSLAALKAWHNACSRTWNNSPRLTMVTRSASASAPASSRRPIRKPVTTDMLSSLVRNLNLKDPSDAAIAATALVAFWGQCRLGELIGTSKLKHDPTKHPSRSSLGPSVSFDGS